MRDGLTLFFSTAMLVVTMAPRPHSPLPSPRAKGSFELQAAWLAQRESAIGDWESVKTPLREGDELQLTVLASEDACVYVFDGAGRQLFPAPDAAPEMARVRAHWPYALPGRHRTWRLDDADHDHFFLVASRHPLYNPWSMVSRAHGSSRPGTDLTLPLRDGRPGAAAVRVLDGEDLLFDEFVAR
jgi:hypothetical protein